MFRSTFISGSLLLLALLGNVQADSSTIPIHIDIAPGPLEECGSGLTPELAERTSNQQLVTARLDTEIIQELKRKNLRTPAYVYLLTVDDENVKDAWKGYVEAKKAPGRQGIKPPAMLASVTSLAEATELPWERFDGYWTVEGNTALWTGNDDALRLKRDPELKAMLRGARAGAPR